MSLREEGGRKKEEIQAMQDARMPEGWVSVGLVDISSIEMGQSPESSSYNSIGEGLPFFQGKAEFRSVFPEIRKWCTAPAKVVEAGDILLSIRAPVGPTNIAPQKSCIGRGLAGIRGEAGVNQHYLYYFFKYIEPWLSEQGTGSTFAAISGQFVREISCPVAPAPEQIRIVAKLEELLSDLDAGVAELKAAQKKLAQYQQSLLKAAVEGQLTADWRAQHPPTETGAELLARILQERRARWEAKQLEKFVQQGKTPPKNWQGKYPEPIPPDTRNLPTLPEGWVWASVDQLLYEIEAGKSFKCDGRPPHDYEVGVVKVSAVTWGEYDEHESKTCFDESLVCPELFVAEGDFLFSRANTISLIGACVISKKVTKKIMLSDKILRFHFSDDSMKLWLLHLLRSKFGRNQIEMLSSGNQESMRNIGQEKIKQIAVPIPSLPEMMHTMNVLTRALNAATHQTAAINFSLEQTAIQRQNILRAAFAGELVPQDLSDEPASALLERIRAQRAAQTPDQKPRGRRKKETP